MNFLLYYLIQVIIASGILYLYYHFALRNKKFHQYNRFYLLAAVVISVLVPFLNIPVYFSQQETQSSFVLQTLTVISSPYAEQETDIGGAIAPAIREAFDPASLLYYVYGLLALLALLKITFSILRISRLKKNNPVEKIDRISFINTSEPGTPFSFFRWLFWNKNIELRSEKGEQIFRHELFHIQQKHSLDLLFMELLTVIFWINPFFYIMKKELRAIHEFLADQFAVNKSDKWNYAELLLMQALQTKHSLVNPFFHNQIKRRIAMITNPQKTSHRYLRKLLVLPFAVLIVTAFAFKYKNAKTDPGTDPVVAAAEPITIIIDPGHGGIDPGGRSPDKEFNEAQLSLELAKKIQELSPEYNIKVVLTRETDVLPGGATNTNDGHLNRVKIANDVKPAAFIAIHFNNLAGSKVFQNKRSGIEAYVSAVRSDEKGRKIASGLLQALSSIYKTDLSLKTRDHTGIYVLDKNECPAVILQCCYLESRTDMAYITDKANQEKIARKILEAIAGYNNSKDKTGDQTSVTLTSDSGSVRATFVDKNGEKMYIRSDSIVINYDKNSNSPLNISASYLEVHKPESVSEKAVDTTAPPKAPEIMIVGYLPSTNKEIATTTAPLLQPVEVGSAPWRQYFERNLNGNIPIAEGWKPGNYRFFIQFMTDDQGNILETTVLNYVGSKTAIHCEELMKRIPSIKVSENERKYYNNSRYYYYSQAITFSIIDEPVSSMPSITLSNLQKAPVAMLLGVDPSTNVSSFRFTIDLPNGEIVQSRNTGNQFNETTRKLIQEATVGRMFTIDFIEVIEKGQIKKRRSRLYSVIEDPVLAIAK
jgi:N-acetylmuramoyl-L-alanine amidase